MKNRRRYAWPFQNTHAYAKNTVRCTSGIGLIHESLTHGFIVFDKIPRILFMRKFWHNGKPGQAQARSSRCPGLRPRRCWLSSFSSGFALVPSNSQSKLPYKREQYSSLTLKTKWRHFLPNGCVRADPTCTCQEGHVGV